MIQEASVSGEYSYKGEYHKNLDPKWRFLPTYLEKMRYIEKLLGGVGKKEKILDLGCGEGVLVERLFKKGYSIRGVDLNYQSEFVARGDITALDIPSQSVDVVLALDVIEHINFEQQTQAFLEIKRILKPGGRAIVSLPNLAHFSSRLTFFLFGELIRTSTIERHKGDRPIREYVRLYESLGFTKVRKKGLFPTLPFISLITCLKPVAAIPLHRLYNLFPWPIGWCFLSIFELRIKR